MKEESSVFEKYLPEREREAASNAYLMSLVGAIAGLPLPIINLAATGIFFLMNRKRTAFVKFHCMQALLSQLLIVIINSFCLGWTIKVFIYDHPATDLYFGYLGAVVIFNLAEYAGTIAGAIAGRKGKMYSIFFFGPLSYLFYKEALQKQAGTYGIER